MNSSSPAVDKAAESPSHYLPLGYRPEVDGLRAIAVLAVVCYHAGLSFPGGYVGVDVFFVISGYLITGLLLKSLRCPEGGSFSLVGFWERRVRRIFPACAVMVLATLVVGWLILPANEYAKLGWSAVAQAGMAANLFFWRQPGGYFADSEVHPLLHTWSLAVEEQFYLIFPLLLLLWGDKVIPRPGVMRRWLWIGFGVSFALAVAALPWKSGSVFFLLPTRAWELLAGALLAATPAAWFSKHGWVRECVALLGLVGILVPMWAYSVHTVFPGAAALPPVLGTVALIWANTRRASDKISNEIPTVSGRLLAWRPLVGIGLISYSLYLWHWPVLVFWHYGWVNLSELSLIEKLWPVIVSGILAVASWRWIELPFRKKRIATSRQGLFGMGTAMLAVLVVAGSSLGVLRGVPGRLPDAETVKLNDASMPDLAFNYKVHIEEIINMRVPRIGSDNPDAKVEILLWGDSHAMHTVPALGAFCRNRGIAAEFIAYSWAAPLMGGYFDHPQWLGGDTTKWTDATIQHIQRSGTKEIILAAAWASYEGNSAKNLEDALIATVDQLQSMGCRVWILQDVPGFEIKEPRAFMRELWQYGFGSRITWDQTEEEHRRRNSVLYKLAGMGLPATFIDPAPSLLDPLTKRYRIKTNDIALYYDSHHLTARGSKLVLLPIIEQTIGSVLPK